MMDYEIDYDGMAFDLFRLRTSTDRLEQLHEPIEQNIRSIYRSMESWASVDDYPVDFEDEWKQIEDLIGIAFVAAQTHLTVVRTSMLDLSKYLKKTKGQALSFITDSGAFGLFDLDNPPESKSGRSYVSVVNAVANYWKHNDEWPEKYVLVQLEDGDKGRAKQWDIDEANNMTRKTMEIVTAIGMQPGGSNMECAASTLGISTLWDLSPLRNTLKDWGESLLRRVEELPAQQ